MFEEDIRFVSRKYFFNMKTEIFCYVFSKINISDYLATRQLNFINVIQYVILIYVTQFGAI